MGSPVWIADRRVSVAASSSIDNATVMLDKGEMSFGLFDFKPDLDDIVLENQTSVDTLTKLQAKIGKDALPGFLIDYIKSSQSTPDVLAIHTASSIAGSKDANQAKISRAKGFLGKSQLELNRFPNAVHHVKILYNKKKKARLFYKFQGSVQFIQNQKDSA